MSTRSLPLILVVDDESKIRRLLTKELEANGFDVVCAGDGEQALEVFAQSDPTPDLVLMDVMMPGMDGFDCAERLSKSANVPIIFLSARNEPSFKLRGFDSGADDYITKPFLTEELIARIRAVMRRAHTSEEHNAQREYRNGPMRLSESSRSLWINDREVKLADSEYHLMLALMKHPGSVISHEHLLQRVWGGHCSEPSRSLLPHPSQAGGKRTTRRSHLRLFRRGLPATRSGPRSSALSFRTKVVRRITLMQSFCNVFHSLVYGKEIFFFQTER